MKNSLQRPGELPDQIAKLLEDDKERIQWFAAKYANAKDVFFIYCGTSTTQSAWKVA